MAYKKVGWKDYPDKSTPTSALNLNHMDDQIAENAADIVTINATLEEKADALSLAAVATSGSYSDLSNKPTIPTNTNQLTNGAGFITSSGTAANVSGTVAVAHGGTGATTAANARTNLGLGAAATYGVATSVANNTNLIRNDAVYNALAKIRPTLLWTNPSPTSDFAGKSVSIAATNYSWFIVECKATKDSDNRVNYLVQKNVYSKLDMTEHVNARRFVTISNTAAVFTNAEYFTAYNSTATNQINPWIIPVRIYGVLS